MKSRSYLWSAALVGALACRQESSPVRIGVLATLTGTRVETSGQPTLEAARLMERQVNANGGILMGGERHKLVLDVRDIGDDAEGATRAAQIMINQDSVAAIIGPQFSINAIPIANLAENAQLPMISPMSSHPKTTEGKRYVFRIAYRDDFQAHVLASFARTSLHAATAAMLFDVTAQYNRDLAARFDSEFTALGGRITASETYTTDRASDFRTQLARIRGAGADVLFLPNYVADDTIQIRQAREAGIHAIVLGSDVWDPFVIARHPDADGSYCTTQWSPAIDLPQARTFIADYQREFGHAPKGTAAATYDALGILVRALEHAGSTDAARLRTAIAGTRAYPGTTGSITYDGSGDPVKDAVVLHIEHDSVAFHALVHP